MERKQEEQARKMKELQSHVEGSQRNNDQSRNQIEESREPGKCIINKAFCKASLSIFVIAHLKSLDGVVNDLSGPI